MKRSLKTGASKPNAESTTSVQQGEVFCAVANRPDETSTIGANTTLVSFAVMNQPSAANTPSKGGKRGY